VNNPNTEPEQSGSHNSVKLIESVPELEQVLSEPTPEVISTMKSLDGDLMLLGVGGKMGPSMARLARRAADAAGRKIRIIGVSRFSNGNLRSELEANDIETIPCDLLDPEALSKLPEIPNIIYMAGKKFGSTGSEASTWAMNTYLPGMVAQKFPESKIVAFSTGNVYPLSPVTFGGTDENHPTGPIGEYAQSCLGRERILEYYCTQNNTPAAILRLSYAIDLRYGVILDIAQKVYNRQPVDVTMGHAAIIWQGDANAQTLRALDHCGVPPVRLNITGPETVSIRWMAQRLGFYLGVEPIIEGKEAETALLINSAKANKLFGYPKVSLDQMIQWIAHWVEIVGETHNKPTHFETRDGKF
jgi:nucleoside-diphosphate-sugar epimerase